MQKAFTAAVVWVIALALPVCTASAGTIAQWGDFTVKDQGGLIPVNAWSYHSVTPDNPAGFPPPSEILPMSTYPALSSGSLTVKELRDFYSSQGMPNNTFGLIWNNDDGNPTLLSLVVAIDGAVIASANFMQDGSFTLPANTYLAFLTNIDLSGYYDEDEITILYVGGFCSSIYEVQFAGAHEPISMAFLGTGFVAMVLARIKKRKPF